MKKDRANRPGTRTWIPGCHPREWTETSFLLEWKKYIIRSNLLLFFLFDMTSLPFVEWCLLHFQTTSFLHGLSTGKTPCSLVGRKGPCPGESKGILGDLYPFLLFQGVSIHGTPSAALPIATAAVSTETVFNPFIGEKRARTTFCDLLRMGCTPF